MRKQQAIADLQLQVERSRIAIAEERFVCLFVCCYIVNGGFMYLFGFLSQLILTVS